MKTAGRFKTVLMDPLFKNICLYLCFHMLIWILHVLLASTIAFFHFLLDHDLGVVEDWIFNKGWEVLMVIKISAFYIFFKFITVKIESRHPFKNFLVKNFMYPQKEIVAVIIILLLFTMVLGRPRITPFFRIENLKIFISFFSIFLFYILDIFIVKFFNMKYPLDYMRENVQNLLYPLIFFIMSKMIFLYEINMTFLVYFNFLFCFYVGRWKKDNWFACVLFLFFYVCPMGALFGLDPVWGDTFSPFKMGHDLKISYFIVLAFILIGYLIGKEWGFYPEKRRIDGGGKS